MSHRRRTFFFTAALVFAGMVVPTGNSQQTSGPVKVVHLTGLTGVKDDAKGTLSVENSKLRFVHGKEFFDLSATSIEDIVGGASSKQSVGKTVGAISMAAPYGGGRFLSLFRTKVDTLTVQYRDADGGLHGAIFTMPVGAADGIKKELLAQGAHTATTEQQTAPPASATNPPNKEQKQ